MMGERRTNGPLSSFAIPATGGAQELILPTGAPATPRLSPGAMAVSGVGPSTSVVSLDATLQGQSGVAAADDEEGQEDALSAYVVSERRVGNSRLGQPVAEETRDFLAANPREPVYGGIPIRDEQVNTEEKKWSKSCRCWVMIGAFAIISVIAAAVTVAVVNASRPSSSPDTTATDSISEVPVINRTYSRFFHVKSVLLSRMDSLPPSSLAVLEDSNSPQGMALEWLANEDERRVDPDKDTISLVQRYVLATLYFSTNGPNSWTEKCNFLQEEHECMWNAPGIPGVHTTYGYTVPLVGAVCGWTNNFTVYEINLLNNNMTGSLPEELGLLSDSDFLILGFPKNRLSGPIPVTLFRMPLLYDLYLSENQLSGPIPEVPDSAANATKLIRIILEDNQLNGTIPSSLNRLSNITHLSLAYNQLTGSVPVAALGTLSELQSLWLDSNSLQGTLLFPPGSFPMLRELFLTDNLLSSTFPQSVLNLGNLRDIDFDNNLLSGSLPSDFGRLSRLLYLVTSNNVLTGTIPLNFNRRLQVLSIFGNRLNGTISPSIENLPLLRSLDLGRNELRGILPDALGSLTNLESLRLSSNRFSGYIHAGLGRLRLLDRLYLHNNSFSGELAFVCNMTGLYATADCFGESSEVICPCCSECCQDGIDGPTDIGCFPLQ